MNWRHPSTPTAKDAHEPEPDVEQRKGVRNQRAHSRHPSGRHEHATSAVRAPQNRRRREDVAKERVQGHDHADQARCHEGQEAIAKDGRGARECQRRGEVAATAGGGGSVVWVLLVGLLLLLVLALGFGRGHEGEDEVERGGAEEGEAVDVAEMDLAREEEEGAEEEEEEDRAGEVGVIHEMRVNGAVLERVENRRCLGR